MYVFGDVHNGFSLLNKYLDTYPENTNVIVCGDLGYFPNIAQAESLSSLNTRNSKIYFCPGNHEDWDSLDKITKDPIITEIENNVFYCPFGSTLLLEGYNILFCGGASSPDRKYRTPGFDWFYQESISYADMNNLPDGSTHVDIIISHTCPVYAMPFMELRPIYDSDTSQVNLNYVFDMYHPALWIFGHLHRRKEFTFQNTHFIALNMINKSGGFIEIGERNDI